VISLARAIALPVSPDAVWARLWDVQALAGCIPGCDAVETVEDHRRYRAVIRDRVGPFSVAIPLDVAVQAQPPSRLEVRATGRDTVLGSPVRVSLVVTVDQGERGGTHLNLDGSGEIGGKLAALGQGLIDRKTRDVLDRFADNLTALFAPPGDAAAV
jgi:carbon monoxide dehydrogenase subunit G